MHSKGLINKIYRPIEANNTTLKTSQFTLCQSKTPPAEKNHFITINDSINKTMPPLLNRSLSATSIVEPNTTPRVLSIGNSSLIAKLKALEVKLCRKIMAMKPYFMNELRSLKQEAPLTKKQDYSQDDKIALKLLELENRLLRCYVSNKQKLTRY